MAYPGQSLWFVGPANHKSTTSINHNTSITQCRGLSSSVPNREPKTQPIHIPPPPSQPGSYLGQGAEVGADLVRRPLRVPLLADEVRLLLDAAGVHFGVEVGQRLVVPARPRLDGPPAGSLRSVWKMIRCNVAFWCCRQ